MDEIRTAAGAPLLRGLCEGAGATNAGSWRVAQPLKSSAQNMRRVAGGPAFKIFGTKYEKGAPSLRFLQGRGRAACMMRFSGKSKNGTASCIVPTLRRVREAWGTRFIMASATERLGHPPSGMITYP